jgi:hypothetical protein
MRKTTSQLAILACILHSIYLFPRMAVYGVLAKFVCSLESFSFWAREKRLKRSLEQPRAGHLQKKPVPAAQQRFPLCTLTSEVNAVTTSIDFITFMERSSKIIARALDEDYDLLAGYPSQTDCTTPMTTQPP